MNREPPPFLRDMLSVPPRAGEGVHAWLFRVARQMHAHLPATEIFVLLRSLVANCGRHVSDSEIWDAIKNSLASAWQPRGQSSPVPSAAQSPKVNAEQREAVIRDNGGLADLWELSDPRIEDSERHTEEIIDRLFPGNPLLCCGKLQSDFDTKPRQEWRAELAEQQFIVPSPMSAVTGTTKNGTPSAHCLSNTGERRFLVVEFDSGEIDDQAALILHLGTFAPLVCVVHSAGKSLHSWFLVARQPDEKVLKFFRYAVSLGADPATWTRSQFVRMPDGRRDNGKRQPVYFLNFKPMETK